MDSPEESLGALCPELNALASWFDRQDMAGFAVAIRDWHPSLEGPWRAFAEQRIESIHWYNQNSKLSPKLRTAIRLLRTPRRRLKSAVASLDRARSNSPA